MAGRRLTLRGAIFKLVPAMLLFYSLLFPETAAAENTVPGSFSVPLVISNVFAVNTTITNAEIYWITNGVSTSQVYYDTQFHDSINDYAFQSYRYSNPVGYHHILLTGLEPSTVYNYRVESEMMVEGSLHLSISPNYTFITLTPGSTGGGGDGSSRTGSVTTVKVGEGTDANSCDIKIDSQGRALNSCRITTNDETLTVCIDAGTRMVDMYGQPLTFISAGRPAVVNPPPSQRIILLAYELGPEGASFTPPITITMNYNSLDLPGIAAENTLYIAFWNGLRWQALPSVVDILSRTVTASTSHFSLFALMGVAAPAVLPSASPTPTAAPVSSPQLSPEPANLPAPSSTLSPSPAAEPVPTPLPLPSPSSEYSRFTNVKWLRTNIGETAILGLLVTWLVVRSRRH